MYGGGWLLSSCVERIQILLSFLLKLFFWVALGRLLAGMIMKLLKLPTHSELDYPHSQTIIGASLMSTPHTSETALQRRVYNVYVCPFVCSHIMSTC